MPMNKLVLGGGGGGGKGGGELCQFYTHLAVPSQR